MNKKYVNIFWVVVSLVIILNEFIEGRDQLINSGKIHLVTWLISFIWVFIAAKNMYSFYVKNKMEVSSIPQK